MKVDKMKTRYSLFLFSVIFFIALLSGNMCLADRQRLFHSEDNGYSITIPDGWIRVPDEIVVEAFEYIASAQAKATYSFEMAFQQSASGPWFDNPYVLVQVIKYSNLGLNRQMPISEFKKYVTSLTGIDVDNVIDENFSADAKGMFSGGAIGEVSLDQENKLYVFGLEMNVADVGKTIGQCIGHFGQYSIIQVNFYDLESNWNQSTAERELIQGSFKFDPAMAYNEAVQKPIGFIEGVLPFAVLAIVLVGITVALRYVMKPETKVKIGRVTVLFWVFRSLLGPVVGTIREHAAQELTTEQALAVLGLSYLLTLPLIVTSVGLYWALIRNKLKAAIAFFVIQAIWYLYSGIVAGSATLLLEVIVIFLVLQGILGNKKILKKCATEENKRRANQKVNQDALTKQGDFSMSKIIVDKDGKEWTVTKVIESSESAGLESIPPTHMTLQFNCDENGKSKSRTTAVADLSNMTDDELLALLENDIERND